MIWPALRAPARRPSPLPGNSSSIDFGKAETQLLADLELTRRVGRTASTIITGTMCLGAFGLVALLVEAGVSDGLTAGAGAAILLVAIAAQIDLSVRGDVAEDRDHLIQQLAELRGCPRAAFTAGTTERASTGYAWLAYVTNTGTIPLTVYAPPGLRPARLEGGPPEAQIMCAFVWGLEKAQAVDAIRRLDTVLELRAKYANLAPITLLPGESRKCGVVVYWANLHPTVIHMEIVGHVPGGYGPQFGFGIDLSHAPRGPGA